MRLPALFLFQLIVVVTLYSQNLITNPGFESDSTGWSSLYTRVPSTGLRSIVTTPVNSGAKAVHISYWGTQDWAQQTQSEFAVRAGQRYEFSAWVRTDSLPAGSSAGISVVLSDSAHQAIDWSYATAACTLSSRGSYSQYSSRFIIPSGAAYIRPRILGYGPSDLYADDASLRLTDSLPLRLTRPFVLQNSRIRASIDPLSFSFSLTSLATAQTRTAAGVAIFQVTAADTSFPDSAVFHCIYLPGNWPVDLSFSVNGPALSIALRADSARALTQDMKFPGPISSLSGEYLLVPNGTGMIFPALNASAYMNKYTWLDLYQWQADMSFTGATDLTKGYMITTDDPWFSRFFYDAPSSTVPLSAHVALLPAKHLFAKNRTVHYTMIDTGGYVGMCAWYRSHVEQLGYVRTWAQKTQAIPATDRLKGAVDFWFNGKGFWFQNASVFRELIDYGIDRAIYTGNYTNQVVDTLNSLGFLTSEYDCYCDAYPPSSGYYKTDGYNTDAIVKEDGKYALGWLAYLSNGDSVQAQEVCAASHAKFAIPNITTERVTKHLNTRFIDVELAIALQECWSTAHPVNRYTDARARVKLFDTLRKTFGLVLGGEQARDFAFPFVDYGEGTMSFSPVADAGYDWSTPEAPDSNFVRYNINPANHVPLHGLVYHDVHIPTWYTGDGQSKVPAYWDDKDLFNILYASMPLFMPPDTGYWKANFEHFLTSYNLVSAVTRNAGFAKMTGHRALSTDWRVQQTTFDNGWTVTVNFDSTNSYALGNRTLSPRGFYATDGTQVVYRLLVGGQRIAVALLSDRLFVNGYGSQQAVNGIKSSGAVLLKSNPGFIQLAFIGSQSYIDVDTLRLPWPVVGMRVFTKSRSQEIGHTTQPNGFVRITRIAGVDIYRIEGTITGLTPATANKVTSQLSVSVSRSGRGLLLRGTCNKSEDIRVTIFNVTGRTVASMQVRANGAGVFGIKTSHQIAPGIYSVRVETGRIRKNRTLVRMVAVD